MMSIFSKLLASSILCISLTSHVSAVPIGDSFSIKIQHNHKGTRENVRHHKTRRPNLCENWHRECGRLWHYGSTNWNACMSQPAALYDCGRRAARSYRHQRKRDRRQNLCNNWHRECARLHGQGSRNWSACMQQPDAIHDCGRRGARSYGYERNPYRGQSLCNNWYRECTRLHGQGSRNWNACMQQPGALRDCSSRNW